MRLLLWFLTFSTLPAFAQGSPSPIAFSLAEIAQHKKNIGVIVEVARECLDQTWLEHTQYYQRHGISKFYGDRLYTPKMLSEALKKYGKSQDLLKDLEPISCIGMTITCLREGFAAGGMAATFQRIEDFLYIDKKVLGTDLQRMLIGLGWTSLYWNPDPSRNQQWDNEDRALTPLAPGKKWMPVWGGHAERYRTVMKSGVYYGLPIHDATSLVGFRDVQPKAFAQVPFFVGIAHAGYHVFPGYNGRVIEAHSMRQLNSFDNLEVSEFNPLATGGGPRWTKTEKYRSGVIVIPPQP